MKKKTTYLLICGLTLTLSLIIVDHESLEKVGQSYSFQREQSFLDTNSRNHLKVSRQNAIRSISIKEFHLKVDYQDKGNLEIFYTINDKGQIESKVTNKTHNTNESLTDQKAITYVEALMDECSFTSDTSKNEALTKIQNTFDLDLSSVNNLALFVQFKDGKTLQIQENFKPHIK